MLDIHVNHFLITGILTIILLFIYFKNSSQLLLVRLLTLMLVINFTTFNFYLIYNGDYNFRIHLPLHLCYIAELGILLSIFFKTKLYYGWLVLNSLGGGITGFLNSNLDSNSLLIEHIHLYLFYFNLILFSIYAYKISV